MRHDRTQIEIITVSLCSKCRVKDWQLRAIFATALSDYIATKQFCRSNIV